MKKSGENRISHILAILVFTVLNAIKHRHFTYRISSLFSLCLSLSRIRVRACECVFGMCCSRRHWKAGEELNFDACKGCNVVFMACDQGH